MCKSVYFRPFRLQKNFLQSSHLASDALLMVAHQVAPYWTSASLQSQQTTPIIIFLVLHKRIALKLLTFLVTIDLDMHDTAVEHCVEMVCLYATSKQVIFVRLSLLTTVMRRTR